MKVFHCDQCNQLLFFENSQCVNCGSALAYVPEAELITSVPKERTDIWKSRNVSLADREFRLCQNYVDYQTCNWAVDVEDGEALCRSCRLTRTIPDVSDPQLRLAWFKLESAKRRLLFTLMALRLPLLNRVDDGGAGGLAFDFKADPADPAAPRVLTGHGNGVITVNVAEADDVERERRRHGLGEPYRTLLGHMRHESGHFYWDRLLKDAPEIEQFRQTFGDERADYSEALQQHYEKGPPADWQDRYVTAYASAHPWEDWAETWAHYLHMVDALDTAAENGLQLRPRRADEPTLPRLPATILTRMTPIDSLIDGWFTLTYALNNLNRSLGLVDAYPFVLSPPVVEKLRYVHQLICRARSEDPIAKETRSA